MKITVVSSSIDPTNGWGNITYELCRQLSQSHELELYLPRNCELPDDCHYDIKPVLPPPMLTARTPLFCRMLSSFMAIKPRGDVVHSLFAFPYAIPAAISATLHKKPLIVGMQGTYGIKPLSRQPDRSLLMWAYRRATMIHCASGYTKERLLGHADFGNKTVVIPNGVNYERFNKDSVYPEDVFKSGGIILGVGALKPRKGFDVMIRAFKLVRDEIPDVKYVIIGEGPGRSELVGLAESLGVENGVHFLGERRGDDLVSAFHFCDVYAHTPVNINDEFEGFGIVYLEAGACGKPVVGSKSGGVPDAVIDNLTGLIVPENDVEATARALIKLLNDREWANRLGTNGKERAMELSWANIAKRYEHLYWRAKTEYEHRKELAQWQKEF